jgi:hypothetical protein
MLKSRVLYNIYTHGYMSMYIKMDLTLVQWYFESLNYKHETGGEYEKSKKFLLL